MKRQKIINFNFGFIESFGMLMFMGAILGGVVLLVGVKNDNPLAIATLGAIVAVTLMVIGGMLAIVVLWFGRRTERGRDEAEQARFVANTKENLLNMAAMQRVQNQQNALLLKQAQTHQRMIASGDDVIDVDALVIESGVFEGLED